MDRSIDKVNYDQLIILLNKCDRFLCFKYQNLLIRGNDVDVIKRYLKENPSKKFRIWLIDNNLVIKEF